MSALASLPTFSPRDEASTTTRVDSAVRAIAQGEMVILVDDMNRENEGDLVIAAEFVDAAAVNFMATYGRGLICISMTAERLAELEIPPMAARNTDPHHTAFHVGVDVRQGTSTGISANDRALTARALADPGVTGDAFTMPGHLFPLAADAGGLEVRQGHTEASVELTRLAGLSPSAVICEIAGSDGEMARLPELLKFARKHGLQILAIDELARVTARSPAIERVVSTRLPARDGDFEVIGYRDHVREQDHLALLLGDISSPDPLVYLHSECLFGDVFHSTRCSCHPRLEHALEAIRREGRGAIVYVRQARETGHDWPFGNPQGLPCADQVTAEDDRSAAAAILTNLGVRTARLLTTDPAVCYGLARHGIKAVATWTDVTTAPFESNREKDKSRLSRSGNLNGRLASLVSH